MLHLHTYDLGNTVTAFSTLRKGGYSVDAYASFNINYHCGDNPAHIAANRTLLCTHLAIENDRLIYPHQTHGTTIRLVDEPFFALTPSAQKEQLEGVDALITPLSEVCIGISTADCIPILIFDPIRRVAAAIHAGWRGTVERISAKCVMLMTAHYGCSPADLRVAIGPGISLEAFEVGDEVYDAFLQQHFPMEQMAQRFACAHGIGEKWHIDLFAANRHALLEQGIPLSQIHLSNICTHAHHDRFFSARRLSIRSGRIFSGIMMR